MARMPGAQWLGEHSPKRAMSRYDIVCVHTIVGYAPAHAAHFSTHQGGTIQQSRDTRYRSAANLNGNHRVISIENEDFGSAFPKWSGSNVPSLTAAQVEANARILAWAHKTHGVPLQLCPNSRPTSRGLAYHRQGIDGNFGPFKYGGRVSGGEVWSSSFGKVCPGDRRIDQRPAILARAKQIVNGTPAEDDMALNAKQTFDAVWNVDDEIRAPKDRETAANRYWYPSRHLAEIGDALFQRFPNEYRGEGTITPRSAWKWTHYNAAKNSDKLDALSARMDALIDAQAGMDSASILTRIDQRAAESSAEREALSDKLDAAMAERAAMAETLLGIKDAVDGTEDATAALRTISELIDAALNDSED